MKIILREMLDNKVYLVVLGLAIVANIVIIATVTQYGPNVLY